MGDCCADKACELERLALQGRQRRVLHIVLAINASMFAIEFTAGLVAGSSALMADSVDMLGDALVYAFSLWALARSLRWKAGAALLKGGIILAFGIGVIVDAGVRLVEGVPPSSALMLAFGALALVANLTCFRLLRPLGGDDVNMASSLECSRNDLVANAGVLVAALGVHLADASWPDTIVAGAIAFVFLRSAGRVLTAAWPAWRSGLVDRPRTGALDRTRRNVRASE